MRQTLRHSFAATTTILLFFCIAAAASANASSWNTTVMEAPSGITSRVTCVQVGECIVFSGQMAITEHKGLWSEHEIPIPSNAVSPFVGLPTYELASCAQSSETCVALGTYAKDTYGRMLATNYSGVWITSNPPNPSSANAPYPNLVFESWVGLSCPYAGSCVAIARYADPHSCATFADCEPSAEAAIILSDGQWSANWLPVPTGGTRVTVSHDGISCVAEDPSCTVVGSYESSDERTYGAIWKYEDGSWSVTRAPLPGGDAPPNFSNQEVDEIVCLQKDSCSAIGHVGGIGAPRFGPVMLTENDGLWSAQDVPLPQGADNGFAQIACWEVSACLIVTHAFFPDSQSWGWDTLYDQADIYSPSVLIEPPPGAYADSLDVEQAACPQDGWCIVIGSYIDAELHPEPAYLLDNGKNSSLTALPLPADTLPGWGWAGPSSISCPAVGKCVYVGQIGIVDETNNVVGSVGIAEEGASMSLGSENSESSGTGDLVVQSPPPPTPPLTVTTASGGGDGMAGGPDPSSLEHGLCDPGATTNWLHVTGITFTCMVSLQFWSDPGLLSAKDKCIVSLSIYVVPFLKLLKARKYLMAAGTVEASLQTLTRRLAIASYPRKLPGDVQAIDDLRTALQAIKTPEQALLTVISSRRVLDGLITKLGAGGLQSLKLAQDLALVKNAVISLVETVTGIQDVKNCVTAFGGP
jgi:hypothetical protein